MRPLFRHLAVGVLASTLAACSSSDDDSTAIQTADNDTATGVPVAGTPTTGTPTTGTPTTGTPTTDTPTTGTPATGTPTTDTPATGSPTTDPVVDGPMTPTTPLDDPTETGTPTTGTGDVDAPTTGTGDVDAPTTGTGDVDAPTTGTGDVDAPTTGTGDVDAPTTGTGTGDVDAPTTGTGDVDAPTTGTGDVDAPTTGTGDVDAPTTGTGDVDVPAVGTVALDPTGVEVTRTVGDDNRCAAGILSLYVRTLSEACSVEANGASVFDGNRLDEAPTAPTGLTALLVAAEWVQIDWIPSTDNGAVTAYEIYRDGQLVGTVDDRKVDEAGNFIRVDAQRYFRTTTYLDCDYTRFACEAGRLQPGATYEYTVVAIDSELNRSPASAPLTVTTNPITAVPAPSDPTAEGYTQIFGDEFDGAELDRDKWRTSLSFEQFRPDGSVVNGEQQFFVDTRGDNFGFAYDPFRFDGNGTLRIQAARTSEVDLGDDLAAVRGLPYLSGVISSRDKFTEGVRYGYVEMSAKVPSGDGLLSTFFLFQRSGNQYEIDILEYLGKEPDGATQNYHYRDGFRYADNDIEDRGGNPVDGGNAGVAHGSPTMTLDTGTDLSTGFVTYSVLWEPGLVVWYVGGQEVRRMTGPRVSDVSMDIVAQLVLGSPNFAGDPSALDFPVSYEIDYIRAWQK